MNSKKLSKSPQRDTFQKEKYIERTDDENIDQAYLEFFDEMALSRDHQEVNTEWQKNNLEYDLRTCEELCQKVKESEIYAQNLYAALCNTDFQKLDIMHILKDDTWSCSWRYAGGIIADMREEGDYIDWYCSGLLYDPDSTDSNREFVSEGTTTEEICNDIKKLGWVIVDRPD